MNSIVPGTEKQVQATAAIDELDPGISANVADYCETPTSFIKRVLLPNEKVVQEFNVKFPSQFMPLWRIILLCVLTFGLYGFVLLYRVILRWFYRNRLCTPSLVSFKFGKMAVTDQGRIICWEEKVTQKKEESKEGCCYKTFCKCCVLCVIKIFCRETCAAHINYSVEQEFKIFNAKDIKQTTQYFASQALCIFCCLDYRAGIEVAFNNYNHGASHLSVFPSLLKGDMNDTDRSPVAGDSFDNQQFYSWARKIFNAGSAMVKDAEVLAGFTSNTRLLYVHSDATDRVHNGDVHAILRELTDLQKRLNESLPVVPDAISKPDAASIKIKMDTDQFWSNVEPLEQYDVVDKSSNVTIVDTKGKISIPRDMLCLLTDEVVYSTSGQVYIPTWIDWIKCACKCLCLDACYYCRILRIKRFNRSALILTNKRLLQVDILERSGTIPITMSNFSIQVRSYFLGKVLGGFIFSNTKKHLQAGIETPGGTISVNFIGTYRRALPFAMALQNGVSRDAIQCDLNVYKKDLSKDPTLDMGLLPLTNGEIVIDWLRGSKLWESFGSSPALLVAWNQCLSFLYGNTKPVTHVCSKESCGKFCFPALPYVCTCGLRPFQSFDDIIITNKSIMKYSKTQNFGLCASKMCLVKNDRFMLSWVPINVFAGFAVKTQTNGRETWLRRLCKGSCMGKVFCPIGKSKFMLDIDLTNYGYSFKRKGDNKNFTKDEECKHDVDLLSSIQRDIYIMTKNNANAENKV